MNKKLLFLPIVFLCLITIDSSPTKNKKEIVSETESKENLKEIVLGRKLAALYAKKYGVHRNPENTRYLQSVGTRLAENSGAKNLIFYFGILDTKEILLRALPGGYVFISKGLISKLQTEGELAYLLSISVAHTNMNHSLEIASDSVKYFGVEFPFQKKEDYYLENTKSIQKLVTKIEKGFPEKERREAEEAAVLLASTTGYNSKNFISALANLHKTKEWKTRKLTLTHYIQKQGITDKTEEDTGDFLYFRDALGK